MKGQPSSHNVELRPCVASRPVFDYIHGEVRGARKCHVLSSIIALRHVNAGWGAFFDSCVGTSKHEFPRRSFTHLPGVTLYGSASSLGSSLERSAHSFALRDLARPECSPRATALELQPCLP